MKIKCPDCGHEYDLEKQCHLSLNRFTGKNIVRATIRCECSCPINITLTKPLRRAWLLFKKLGRLTVEVKKRAESTT